MTRWKGKNSATARDSVQVQPRATSRTKAEERNDEEIDIEYRDNQNESMNTHLLFTKESLSKSSVDTPLFSNIPRRNFLIMTCKRTLLACRGLFILFVLIVLIISVVTSLSDSGGVIGDQNHKLMVIPLPLSEQNTSWGKASEIQIKFNEKCGYAKVDYSAMGNSLKKSLEFFERNAEKITVLDAALGTFIFTEQVTVIRDLHPTLPNEIVGFLEHLKEKAKVLTGDITSSVKRTTNDTKGLERILPWIETKDLWHLPLHGKWHEVGRLSSYNPQHGESYEDIWEIASRKEIIHEQSSDECIFGVFTCHTTNITDNCEREFLTNPASMYSLTHQIIYVLLGRKEKCGEAASWKKVPTLMDNGDLFLEKMCGKVWQEANSIAEANFPPRYRDLFVEQVGMCSLAGYPEFLRRDWLWRILSWQARTISGCFGERRRRIPTISMLLKNYQRRENEHLQAQLIEKYFGKNKSHKRRDKRNDMYIEDKEHEKCSVHFTSVGITTMSIHLRYFFDTCLDAY